MTKGQSYTTGTVHYAERRASGQYKGLLIQVCGISRRALASLYETDQPVNCNNCLRTH